MDFAQIIQTVALYALPVLFAITVHEAAHGYAARHFGDNTAHMLGRITLNPLKHIDPVGTIAMPLLLYFATSGAFLFGYAKPVPVNFGRLRNPKRDMVWVALAGPGANLLMALGYASGLVALFPRVAHGAPARALIAAGEESGDLAQVMNFHKRIAGADSNVAIGLSRLGFQVAGKLVQRPAQVGQRVNTGALLAQLDAQAKTAVEGWEFKAATRAGQTVSTTIQVPVSFNPPQPKPDECFAVEERLRRGG